MLFENGEYQFLVLFLSFSCPFLVFSLVLFLLCACHVDLQWTLSCFAWFTRFFAFRRYSCIFLAFHATHSIVYFVY